MGNLTVPLDADDSPINLVGGKFHGLQRLMAAGFSVPPGFCITTRAFERTVEQCVADAEDLDELRVGLETAELSESFVASIERRVKAIGASRWAVRSSAVEEDTEKMSFAGQYRSELDVEGVEGIVDAVRRVWSDLYDIEGLLYRARLRVDSVPQPIAVLVQAMVETTSGGVMFTENPVDRSRDELLITASREAGDSVVRGSSGDNYFVDRRTREVTRHVKGGNADEGSQESPLDPTRIRELTDVGRNIEESFGESRDIEWAYGTISGEPSATEQLYLLQARPITADAEEEQPESVWTNANVGEALPGVATPMTWSIIGKFSRRGFERAFGTLGLTVPEDYELVGSFRGRVYLNLTQFVSIASAIPILEPDVLFQMAGGGGLELVRGVAEKRSPVEFLKNLPVTIPRILASQIAMPIVAPVWSRYFDNRVDAFFQRDLSKETLGGLASELDRLDELFDRTGLIMLTCSSNFLMSYVIMKKSLDWFGKPEARERERELVGALEVRSAEPVLDLLRLTDVARRADSVEELIREGPPGEAEERLRRAARTGDEAARRFLQAFSEFRREHGHRAPREAELATPRWREESRFVFDVVQSYLEAPDLPSPDEYRREWSQDRQTVSEIVDRGFGSLFRPIFRLLLAWARKTARIREFMRTHVVEMLDTYRRFALESGRRLANLGQLRHPEDVFYLRHDEVRSWLDGDISSVASVREFPLRVMVRRAVVEALRELPDPPNTFVLRDGEIIAEEEFRRRARESEAPPSDYRRVLEGLSGSRGRVTGRARVIEDPESGETVESGEILVAPYTDVGWTPLFMTASAIVMGLGGPLSHACIVAREFGIPTVVNVHGATDVIETGDRITVDGDEGLVLIHEA